MESEEPSYRHELRSLAGLARFLPVFLGVMLASAFSLSVLYDTADIVLPAWTAGADLLGAYGVVGLITLPLIAWVTAALRRGRAQRVVWAEVQEGRLVVELAPKKAFAKGERLTVPLERVRGGYWTEETDGRRRISLELQGGLSEGDRLVLELPAHLATPICEKTIGAKQEFDLTRRAYGPGIAIAMVSLVAGIVASRVLLGQLVARVAAQAGEHAAAAHSGAWAVGLFVACTGAVAAITSFALGATTVCVGVDGLRIEGGLRSRFFRFDAIAEVCVGRGGLTLLAGRRRVRILAPGAPRSRLEALAAQIEERARAARVVGEALPVVARRGRRALSTAQLGEWRTRIAALTKERGYRVGSVSAEHLFGALERPGGPADERVAAALALTIRGDDESRVRIRAVASEMADEATRSLLLRVAEDEADDASIAALLSRQRQL